ncbi:unnamed protein product [Amoebophrya sp. A120]|nr:unnamed protein product [Amoebophrya sp. A120]|eukprot:GSA120T00003444001.1
MYTPLLERVAAAGYVVVAADAGGHSLSGKLADKEFVQKISCRRRAGRQEIAPRPDEHEGVILANSLRSLASGEFEPTAGEDPTRSGHKLGELLRAKVEGAEVAVADARSGRRVDIPHAVIGHSRGGMEAMFGEAPDRRLTMAINKGAYVATPQSVYYANEVPVKLDHSSVVTITGTEDEIQNKDRQGRLMTEALFPRQGRAYQTKDKLEYMKVNKLYGRHIEIQGMRHDVLCPVLCEALWKLPEEVKHSYRVWGWSSLVRPFKSVKEVQAYFIEQLRSSQGFAYECSTDTAQLAKKSRDITSELVLAALGDAFSRRSRRGGDTLQIDKAIARFRPQATDEGFISTVVRENGGPKLLG